MPTVIAFDWRYGHAKGIAPQLGVVRSRQFFPSLDTEEVARGRKGSAQVSATIVTDIIARRLDLCNDFKVASGGELASQLAAEQVDRIPDNFMHELTRSVPDVNDFVEARMETFRLNQSQSEAERRPTNLVTEASQIPMQAEEVAREVVDTAIRDSMHAAVAQLGRELAPVIYDPHMKETQNQVPASIQETRITELTSDAAEVAKTNVEDAIANARQNPYTCSDKIKSRASNKIISDLIVISKTEVQVQAHHDFKAGSELGDSMAPSSMRSTLRQPVLMTRQKQFNAGSRGHPEVCGKPCSFMLSSGNCWYQSNCKFCHLPLPHWENPLDKQNRKTLVKQQLHVRAMILLDAMRSRTPLTSFEYAANRFVDTLESQFEHFTSCDIARMQDQNGLKRVCSQLRVRTLSWLIRFFLKNVVNELEHSVAATIREAHTKFQTEIEN